MKYKSRLKIAHKIPIIAGIIATKMTKGLGCKLKDFDKILCNSFVERETIVKIKKCKAIWFS